MVITIALVFSYLLVPVLVLWLAERRIFLVHRIGPVVVCYAVGLVVGNVGVLPSAAPALLDTLSSAAVPLAIPLLFFSLDVRGWARSGPRALLSFGLQGVAVAAMAALGFLLFRGALGGEAAKVAGMLMGVYTGGTVNLAAIGTALRVEPSLFVAANAADILLSGLYLLFLMTVGKRILRAILGRPAPSGGGAIEEAGGEAAAAEATSFRGLRDRGAVGALAAAFAVAVLIAAAGASLTFLLAGGWGTITAILVVTTLGIAASFVRRLRQVRHSFALGHYFILVFSLAVGSMANLRTLVSTAPAVAGWVAVAVFGSLLLHTLLARLFRVDGDTMVITSVAAICSPPFVPMVAASLGNRAVIGPGIITGIIGWVVGTYCGIGLALLLGAVV